MAKKRSLLLRPWMWLVLLVLAGVVAAWVMWGEGVRRTAETGTAYGARVACSCRYIAGRSLDDCAKDKLEGMELVTFSDDDDAKSVTASVPLIASDTARFRKGYGCVLKRWEH